MILFDGIHLATTGEIKELHDFAKSIGLKASWFQNDGRLEHYDILSNRISSEIIRNDFVKKISMKDMVRLSSNMLPDSEIRKLKSPNKEDILKNTITGIKIFKARK